MHENCDTCSTDYDITPDNAHLVLFLDYLKASHIEAVCPNGHMEIIYVTTNSFLQVLGQCHLNISFGLVPTDERKEACDATWDNQSKEAEDEVVHTSETPREDDPPHWMLRELFDQMRDYEGSN